jgi:hypothetical protein
MVRHRTKKRPVKQRTKKCPDCGRETVVVDKWSSCQWCHWPLFVKHPPEIEQRKPALSTLPWRWAVVCVVVVIIILYWLTVFGSSDWQLPVFQQLIVERWHTLLLQMLVALIIGLIVLYAVRYLSTRPEVIFVAFVLMGMLLLIASQKGSAASQYISSWINEWLNINLFSAAITVLSLAFTFGAILVSIGRTKK